MSFSLTYGMEAVLLLEIIDASLRIESFEDVANEEGQRQDLDMLDEKCEVAQMDQALYKSRTESYYNHQVQGKKFKVGEWVLKKIESSHAEPLAKLSVTW